MGQLKLYIIGFAGLFFLSVLGAAYGYYSWSQDEIKTLTANNIHLNKAVKDQKLAIESLVKDSVDVGEQVTKVNKEFRNAREENAALKKKLVKHDLSFLAERKPGLIEKRINRGTADVGRCFEILSGAPLTEKEKAVTKKSDSNGSCSDIANPNYKVKP